METTVIEAIRQWGREVIAINTYTSQERQWDREVIAIHKPVKKNNGIERFWFLSQLYIREQSLLHAVITHYP
jgi:hypothetical protein